MNTFQRFLLLRQKEGLSIDKIAHITGYSQRGVYRVEKKEVMPRKMVLDEFTRIALQLSCYGKCELSKKEL